MSIILEGIDLPEKNTRVICLFPNGAEELVVLDADSGATAGRPIQVIQIPKDHGRLIDMDDSIIFHGFNKENFEEYKRRIFEAHGILEAEE